MSFIKENKLYIFLIYINLLFILTLVKICYLINNFNYLFITALILGTFLYYWFYHSALRKGIYKIAFTILVVASTAVFYIKNREVVNVWVKVNFIDKAVYINSLVAKAQPTEFWDYKFIFMILIPLLVLLVMFLTLRGFSNFILVLNLALITTLWYFGYTEEVKNFLFYYILINLVTYSINSFAKNMKRLYKRGVKIEIQSWKICVYAVMVSVIIAYITNLLPQEYSGRITAVKESRIYNKFAKPEESAEEKGDKYKYDLAFSGYDNNKKRLGGPVVLNKLIALRVNSDKPYYLRGNVKDYYDGFSWDQSKKNYIEKKENAEGKTQNALSYSYLRDSNNMKIYPEELNTSTIFTPNYGYNADLNDRRIFYDDIPTFMSDGNISNPYNVYFFNTYFNENVIFNNIVNGQEIREATIEDYNSNYAKYLQLPPNISERVYALVEDITKNATSSFAKVKAIRDYLSKNYKYTLKVSKVPEDTEFLDYFLFTEKKGYCTYFATAETIMCRIAGVPARYVEGFNMSSEEDEDGLYVVRNENAHAWTEVLFLEKADSGFWYTVDAVPNAVEAIHREEEEEKIKEEEETENSPSLGLIPKNRPISDKDNIPEEHSGEAGTYPAVLKIIYIGAPLLFIIILIIAAIFIKKYRIINSKSVIPIYRFSLERLATIGIKGDKCTTDFELFDKLDIRLAEKLKEAAALAYSEYYGGKAPDSFDKRKYYVFIEGYVRKRQNIVEYLIKKYIFLLNISSLIKKVVLLYKRLVHFVKLNVKA